MLKVSAGDRLKTREKAVATGQTGDESRPEFWNFEMELSGFEIDLHDWAKQNGDEFETELLMFRVRVEKWLKDKNEKNTLLISKSIQTLIECGAPKPGSEFFECLGGKK